MTDVAPDNAALDKIVVAHSTANILPAGTVQSTQTDVDDSAKRVTDFVWDGAGRTTGTTVAGTAPNSDSRASHTVFDLSGRLTSSNFGLGSATAITESFLKVDRSLTTGGGAPAGVNTDLLPVVTTTEHTTQQPTVETRQYDTLGNVKSAEVGGLQWEQNFDQAGNVVRSKTPARPARIYDYDSRGMTTRESLPGSTADHAIANVYQHDASGALKTYLDPVPAPPPGQQGPSPQPTSTKPDLLGRPLTRTYADNSTETFQWEGPRLKLYIDRQGRTQKFTYDFASRLSEIHDGNDNVIQKVEYDTAGRLWHLTNKDSQIEYTDYDRDGNPHTTRQTRYRDHTGTGPGPKILDVYEQTHNWNAHGERSFWRMPRMKGGSLDDGWTDSITQDHDAAGNITRMSRTPVGTNATTADLVTSTFRGAGRPTSRTVATSCTGVSGCSTTSIVRGYGYDPATSQLNEMSVRAGTSSVPIAGSHIAYDGLQIRDLQLLGIASNERYSHFRYDGRSRLLGSVYGVTDPNTVPVDGIKGTAIENLSASDFRSAEQRTPRFDSQPKTPSGLLIDVSKIDPATLTLAERAAGHKIDKTPDPATPVPPNTPQRTFHYGDAAGSDSGSQVTDDGNFLYTWDEYGRLTSATQKPQSVGVVIRRVLYTYDARGRLIGRDAQSATATTTTGLDQLAWAPETDTNVLKADGLPASTTFVWDPISDNLVSIFQEPSDPNIYGGPLVRQIIHGGLGYDDPVEVTNAPAAGSTSLTRLYPVYDEAGTGVLQTVLDGAGKVLARSVPNDPYGKDDLDLDGAAIDRVTIEPTKDNNGNVTAVNVKVHATEVLSEATVAAGLRLTTLDSNHGVVKTSTAVPQLVTSDPYTAQFTVAAADWTAFTDPAAKSAAGLPAQSLSVGVTMSLRADAWAASIPVLPAPDWARATQPVYSGSDTSAPDLTLEVRASLTTVAGWIGGSKPSNTLYEVEGLALLASPPVSNTALAAIGSARFQAQPFAEPMTGKNYVRNRWYDPTTGTWLSPDPLGYRDSSNLYAFAGGDPVNGRDPLGNAASVSAKGWIIGQRPDGTHYRFAPEYARQHPMEVQIALESDSDLTPADVRSKMAQAGLPYGATSLPCRRGQTCIGSPASVKARGADYALGGMAALARPVTSGPVGTVLDQISIVNGESPVPRPEPQNLRQARGEDVTSDVMTAVAVPAMAAGVANALTPRMPACVSGGRVIDPWDFKASDAEYDAIRLRTGDVEAISRNTGMPEFQIRRIKDHLFYRTHRLDEGVRVFDSDPEIANAWNRLADGNYSEADIQLLKHEYFESRFEGVFDTDYRTAHGAANRAGRKSGLE